MLRVLGICGSPRAGGNTDLLLDVTLHKFEELNANTEKLVLKNYEIKPCTSCRYCINAGCCCIDDDMT
ncbi:MAG: flavodoxin family protein, partial [Thermoprotei archaeon]